MSILTVHHQTWNIFDLQLFYLKVCKSTKPATLTNHLILLSATRKTTACGLFGLSEVMAPLLGIRTVAACGFKVILLAYLYCITAFKVSFTFVLVL